MTDGRPAPLHARDGDRVLDFDGVILAEASSSAPGKSYWTEIRIFKTEAGRYIVETVGCSNIPGKRDFSTARIAEDAAGAVELLHQYDDDGIRYITHVARRAADAAADADADFASAFRVEHVA